MRDGIRKLVEGAATVVVLPLVLLYRAHLAGFDTTGTWLSLIPGHAGVFLRRAWYQRTLQRCGPGLTVAFAATLSHPETEVGDHVFVGHFGRVGLATIGNDVLIAEHCAVTSGGRQYGIVRSEVPMRSQPGVHTRVTIGDDVWIGAMSMVLENVASHSIVAGGSVVSREYSEWDIIAGVPAKPIGTRPLAEPAV